MSSQTAPIWDVKAAAAEESEGEEKEAAVKVYENEAGDQFVFDAHVEVKNEELTEVGAAEAPPRGENPYEAGETGAQTQSAAKKRGAKAQKKPASGPAKEAPKS